MKSVGLCAVGYCRLLVTRGGQYRDANINDSLLVVSNPIRNLWNEDLFFLFRDQVAELGVCRNS